MIRYKLQFCCFIILLFAISCGEGKKKQIPEATEAVTETVDEAALKAAQVAEDSLKLLKIADSIKQDSLRQVKEHGHVH